jgi:DNA-binding protein H-NS
MPTPKTYSGMLAYIEKLKAQAEVLRKREAEGVIKRITEAMRVYGIKAGDLDTKPPKPKVAKPTAPPKKSKRAVKYADDKGNTWTGGGSTPVWLRTQIEKGRDKEDFRVKKADES